MGKYDTRFTTKHVKESTHTRERKGGIDEARRADHKGGVTAQAHPSTQTLTRGTQTNKQALTHTPERTGGRQKTKTTGAMQVKRRWKPSAEKKKENAEKKTDVGFAL